MKRKKWEKANGFYEDEMGNLYGSCKSCYDCRRVFVPVALDTPRMCGQMLVDGVKDAEVYKDTTCDHFFSWE